MVNSYFVIWVYHPFLLYILWVKGVGVVRCTFVKTRNVGIETTKIKNILNDYIRELMFKMC